jgi:hypothetical protein
MTGDDSEQLREVLERAAEHSRSRRLTWAGAAEANEPWRKFLVGESQPMQQLARVIRLVSPRRSTVLISGETGAGKEMVARAIHMASDRADMPLVAVNCTALPENLLEAELFGHVKGAFTGAVTHRVGRFEQAHRGTLFLDEVGDLPLDIQAKLLRVLQEREFQRIGSSETVKVDVRVIAASNIDLAQAVREGKFREDLYYRLNVVPLRVPALRERPSDIPALVHHLIDKICLQEGLPPRRTREALERLSFYSWPGNVRHKRHGNGHRIERRSRDSISRGFCASHGATIAEHRYDPLPGHFPAGRRPRFRTTRGQHGARYSDASAPQDRRKQGAGCRDAPAQAHHALGQAQESCPHRVSRSAKLSAEARGHSEPRRASLFYNLEPSGHPIRGCVVDRGPASIGGLARTARRGTSFLFATNSPDF